MRPSPAIHSKPGFTGREVACPMADDTNVTDIKDTLRLIHDYDHQLACAT